MSDDEFITALNQAVKQEVVENYLRERCIIEEEKNLFSEDLCSYHGGLAAWQTERDALAAVLITPEAAAEFFKMAGLDYSQVSSQAKAMSLPRPRGLTRCVRYHRLVEGLYGELYKTGEELEKEREKVVRLLLEVNADIAHFEASFDFMSLASFLRSMNVKELERRKIMGLNFTAKELGKSAQSLSFRPFNPTLLDLERTVAAMATPREVIKSASPLLKRVCREHPAEVDALMAPKN
jgi:hypothetical protein